MDTQRFQDSRLTNSVRSIYGALRAVYHQVRAIKNRLSNIIDPPVIILLYHRVAHLPADPEMLAVSPGNFRDHVRHLRAHFNIIRFDEDWSGRKEPAVVVTFDDGYADNVQNALPILEEFGIPATFFVSTGNIGTSEEFWWHRLENILLREDKLPASFRLDDAHYGREWGSGTFQKRRVMYNALNALMQRVTSARRELWLGQLEQWSGADQTEKNIHRSMSPEELQQCAASPWVSIGAHTVTHTALSALPEEQQRNEIITCKNDLEDITGTEVTTFSYPFGRKRDYDRISVRLCREAGFKKAAANFPGQVHRWSDPFQLPRHLVRNWDLDTFSDQIKSFWTR